MQQFLKPKPLKLGSLIGISSFASLPKDIEVIDRGVSFLQEHGFRVKIGRCAKIRCSDDEKAKELMNMFSDPEIDAIISVRGGYGTLRYLDKLDYELIRANPKPLVGFSDMTALLMAIHKKSRMVTFYGPMVASNFAKNSEFSLGYLVDMLEGKSIELKTSSEPIVEGVAQGRLVGGCLSIMMTLLCTEFDFSLDDAILFFEDINEDPYKVDRMLTQLILSGKLRKLKGVAVGRMTPPNGVPESEIIQVVGERLGPLNIPIAYDFPFGHMTDIATIPIGIMAELDATSGKLKMLEPAVEVSETWASI